MNNQQPLVLIYKRTHTGDPGLEGHFGINGCMGRVRNWNYDSVIGIGGKRPWQGDDEIAFRINWVGTGANKDQVSPADGWPLVSFAKFKSFDEKGELVEGFAQKLYEYMYKGNQRLVKSDSLPAEVYEDVLKILELADNAPPSANYEEVIHRVSPLVEKTSLPKKNPANKETKGCR